MSGLLSKAKQKVEWATRTARQSSFVSTILSMLGARVLFVVASVATSKATAMLLGAEGRGLYFVATMAGIFGMQFGSAGLSTAHTWMISSQPERARTLASHTVAVGGILGMATSIAVGISTYLLVGSVPERLALALGAALYSVVLIINLLAQGTLMGLQSFSTYNTSEVITRLSTLALFALPWVAGAASPASLLACLLVGSALGLAFALHRLHTAVGGFSLVVNTHILRQTLSYGFRAWLATLFAFIATRSNTFLVQDILGATESGYFSAVVNLLDLINVLQTVISTVLFPVVTSLEPSKRRRMIRRTAGLSAAAIVPVCIATAVLAQPLVTLLFGTGFLPAVEPLLYSLPGVLALAMTSIIGQYVAAEGLPLSFVGVWLGIALLNIACTYAGALLYGLDGVAIAYSLSMSVGFLLFLWYAVRMKQHQPTH